MDLLIKPDNTAYFPVASRIVSSAQIAGDCKSIILTRGEGLSYVVFDMGERSVGGYPVFTVKTFDGAARLRVSYSDRFCVMETPESMRKGDFVRGCCKYLGTELPVYPANPGRYEEYTIARKGVYVFPLIQGQQRFVAIELIGGKRVEIENFYIYGTSAAKFRAGAFHCSDDRLDKLWEACADTLDLATVRADTLDCAGGYMLLRGLTQGENGVIRCGCADLADYTYSVRFGISYNPDCVSGLCAYFRAPDRQNGYAVHIDLDGTVTAYLRTDGVKRFLVRRQRNALTDNLLYMLSIECRGSDFRVCLDGEEVLSFTDATYPSGSFGFCQDCEKWAFAERLEIKKDGMVFISDDYTDLNKYEMVHTPYFISDGAKRDRLPWSGDIDWAFRSGFYSHGLHTAMADTLRMFSRHQTPEGYIMGTFYPEYEGTYRKGEYGHYESDMFAGWYIVAAGTYYKYSGDLDTIRNIYPSIRNCLLYLMKSIEADGLFNQRYETSKGLWDHQLGDTGKNSYTNLIVWECFRTGAFFAEELKEKSDAALFAEISASMRRGIFSFLWSDKCGGFVKTLGKEEYCDMANPFAMGKGLVSFEQAAVIARSALDHTKGYGKILSLMISGLYTYGYDELAYKMLTSPRPFRFANGEIYAYVDWLGITDTADYPHMTTECMHFPPINTGNNTDWGDLSHPDSGVNDILGEKLLGVYPVLPGFKVFGFKPHTAGLNSATGEVETPFGKIYAEWEMQNGELTGRVICPEECECVLPENSDIVIEKKREKEYA